MDKSTITQRETAPASNLTQHLFRLAPSIRRALNTGREFDFTHLWPLSIFKDAAIAAVVTQAAKRSPKNTSKLAEIIRQRPSSVRLQRTDNRNPKEMPLASTVRGAAIRAMSREVAINTANGPRPTTAAISRGEVLPTLSPASKAVRTGAKQTNG